MSIVLGYLKPFYKNKQRGFYAGVLNVSSNGSTNEQEKKKQDISYQPRKQTL